METHLLASGNAFFIYVLEFSASDSLFLVERKCSHETNPSFWLVEAHFMASGNAFLIYFLDISARDSFFSRLMET